MGLKCVQQMLLVRVLLRRIQINKDLFLIEIEQGQEVFIPKDLSQSQYPLSFRYYDPLIKIVKERMTDDRKDFYKVKNELELKIYRKADTQLQMREKLGLQESQKRDDTKLTFRHTAINKRSTNTIQIADSIHSKAVQRSNFLKIDNELMQEIHLNPGKVKLMGKNVRQRKLAPGEIPNEADTANTDELFLKFCKTEDIGRQQ